MLKIRKHKFCKYFCPGIVVAALSGGSGKTVFSVGMLAILNNKGISVAPFKKGPDYIDAGWLSLAAGRPCYNLDTFLIDRNVVVSSYLDRTEDLDFSIIEGNRGLYDCIDVTGETSTAALARLLNLPVVLCVDVTKVTKTMAAIISGVVTFDSRINIAGVVLNRVSGVRHCNILVRNIERYCGVPVIGAIPKVSRQNFPERHMGLVPTVEHKWAASSVASICSIIEDNVNISEVLEIANYLPNTSVSPLIRKRDSVNTVEFTESCHIISTKSCGDANPVIGVISDSAFQFYYPENFEALKKTGAKLVFINSIFDDFIPDIDALYIGGGFPETYAKELESNFFIRDSIRLLAESGLPIYAECGGLIYLGEKLVVDGKVFSMSGVLPVTFKFSKRPVGHGYAVVNVEKSNPYFKVGTKLLGHEFHYSCVEEWRGSVDQLVFFMKRGTGFINEMDGVCYKNVLATYIHIHALSTRTWAKALVSQAKLRLAKRIT